MKKSLSFGAGFLGPVRNDGVLHTYSQKIAKKLVKAELEESPDLMQVYVGLDGDWDCNNDLLWERGIFKKPEFYKSSCWAKPSLLFVYCDGKEKDGGDCYEDKPFDK